MKKEKTPIRVYWYENTPNQSENIERVIDKNGYIKYNGKKYKVYYRESGKLGKLAYIILNKDTYWNNRDNNYGGYITENDKGENTLAGGSLAGERFENNKALSYNRYAHTFGI